jgi:hypothetical protein
MKYKKWRNNETADWLNVWMSEWSIRLNAVERAEKPATDVVPPGLLFVLPMTLIFGSKQKIGGPFQACKTHLREGCK